MILVPATDKPLILRVQDRAGRGPFKPGLSGQWTDPERDWRPPTWMEEFGWDARDRAPRGWHLGSAVRTFQQLGYWFSPSELGRLSAMGYRVVRVRADRVIGESEYQMFVARANPFRWDAAEVDLLEAVEGMS